MGKRKTLVMFVVSAALIGIMFAVMPFVASMSPSMKTKEDAKVRVKISSIPESGALEIDWYGDKVFLVRQPQLTAFLMPYLEGAYRLPDPTWERAIVPCEKMDISSEGFLCTDTKLHENWRKNARWDLAGRSHSNWMPNLRTVPFRIQDDNVVFSPEYK